MEGGGGEILGHHIHCHEHLKDQQPQMEAQLGLESGMEENHHRQEDHEDSTSMMMMMQMYFEASNKATILVREWKTSSDAEMIGSALIVVFVAIFSEALKFYKDLLRQRQARREYEGAEGNGGQGIPGAKYMCDNFMSWNHILVTVLHGLQLGLSYLLMLVAMTFNVWLFAAVVVGSTLGFFFFSWKQPPSSGDHCS